MRVLVTGSREFSDLAKVRDALLEATFGHQGPHTLVHGGARGADTLAAVAASRLGWTVECHNADWDAPCRSECNHRGRRPSKVGAGDHCPAAGDYRNQLIVDLGADAVIVFYKRGAKNKGTTDCRRRAVKAGHTPMQVIA
jgi:hypothetical protein